MERVWDYPRPPAVVPCARRVSVELRGEVLADSTHALRVLETSHPPTIYVPPTDVRRDLLTESGARSSWCEFKGAARYLDAVVHGRRFPAVGWRYLDPSPGYGTLRDYIAFYPGRVDAACERVRAQQSDFYGGWITSELIGPFKGPPGALACDRRSAIRGWRGGRCRGPLRSGRRPAALRGAFYRSPRSLPVR